MLVLPLLPLIQMFYIHSPQLLLDTSVSQLPPLLPPHCALLLPTLSQLPPLMAQLPSTVLLVSIQVFTELQAVPSLALHALPDTLLLVLHALLPSLDAPPITAQLFAPLPNQDTLSHQLVPLLLVPLDQHALEVADQSVLTESTELAVQVLNHQTAYMPTPPQLVSFAQLVMSTCHQYANHAQLDATHVPQPPLVPLEDVPPDIPYNQTTHAPNHPTQPQATEKSYYQESDSSQ